MRQSPYFQVETKKLTELLLKMYSRLRVEKTKKDQRFRRERERQA